MYLPRHFEETDPVRMHALMRAHPLGAWVVQGPDGLLANHLPFLVDPAAGEHGTLQCHVARANPVWRALADGAESLVMFQGPQAYVTPSWYPGKAEHGKVVPTWNYMVVHAHGVARVHDDPDWTLSLVERLTQAHEDRESRPWQVGDAPADYIAQMLRAIVGIEIPISRLVGKWKLSQNRAREDRIALSRGMIGRGASPDLEVGQAMDPGPAL